MATGSERYRQHQVWETLALKRDALNAARFDDRDIEQWRKDIVEWLNEAEKTRTTAQPALYLSALQPLNEALNALPVTSGEFQSYLSTGYGRQRDASTLEGAIRKLPLPPPKAIGERFVALLDAEITARTERLDALEVRLKSTETALSERLEQLGRVEKSIRDVQGQIEKEREAIKAVSDGAQETIDKEWGEALGKWRTDTATADAAHNKDALDHVATLAATARAGEALAEHAAGTLSASDWKARATRERLAAQWIRAGSAAAFVFAGAIGWFIVNEAVRNNFDLTVGDGILRASVAVVVGAFGALLLRESGRHFREADTAEDVALSLQALAPFYAGQTPETKLAARVQVGDAVLVKNVLSRFAHRDAAKHAGDVEGTSLPALIEDASRALGKAVEPPKS